MANLKLTYGGCLYDRLWPLYRGDVQPEGIDLTFVPHDGSYGGRWLFDRMAGGLEFDVAEMSSVEFITQYVRGNSPMVAIPVFPSRIYRHGNCAISKKSGIKHPKDLEGKKVGVPIYTMTAGLTIRGVLQNEYGVDIDSIHWIQGALNVPGPHGDSVPVPLLKKIKLEDNKSNKSLGQMLVDGEIAATMGSALPDVFRTNPDIVRLFPNFDEIEKDYYKKTKIFPIMHVVAIKRSVYEQYPFVASSMYNALTRSKNIALDRMRDTGPNNYMLPWMHKEIEEIDQLFENGDPFPYGIEPNRPSLEAMNLWLFQQGLIPKRFPIEEMFVPAFASL